MLPEGNNVLTLVSVAPRLKQGHWVRASTTSLQERTEGSAAVSEGSSALEKEASWLTLQNPRVLPDPPPSGLFAAACHPRGNIPAHPERGAGDQGPFLS